MWEGSRRRGDAERERKKAKRKKRDKFSKVVVRREGVSEEGLDCQCQCQLLLLGTKLLGQPKPWVK